MFSFFFCQTVFPITKLKIVSKTRCCCCSLLFHAGWNCACSQWPTKMANNDQDPCFSRKRQFFSAADCCWNSDILSVIERNLSNLNKGAKWPITLWMGVNRVSYSCMYHWTIMGLKENGRKVLMHLHPHCLLRQHRSKFLIGIDFQQLSERSVLFLSPGWRCLWKTRPFPRWREDWVAGQHAKTDPHGPIYEDDVAAREFLYQTCESTSLFIFVNHVAAVGWTNQLSALRLTPNTGFLMDVGQWGLMVMKLTLLHAACQRIETGHGSKHQNQFVYFSMQPAKTDVAIGARPDPKGVDGLREQPTKVTAWTTQQRRLHTTDRWGLTLIGKVRYR